MDDFVTALKWLEEAVQQETISNNWKQLGRIYLILGTT